MSKFLIDVVNFNADASCLSSDEWLEILRGGKNSGLYRWLSLYVDNNKKVVIGFPGATIADIAMDNPESISLINQHPDIFQILIRPFSHDLALLRNPQGFILNLEYGARTIKNEFNNVVNFYLPPEFMLTDEQVYQLEIYGIDGTFVNPNRYSPAIQKRLPQNIYDVRGIFNSKLRCIPFMEGAAENYLESLQKYESKNWNDSIIQGVGDAVFTWRDGESPFFLPNGLNRENFWLANEDPAIVRCHIDSSNTQLIIGKVLNPNEILSYPVHSCLSWMKEFRMMGFINRLNNVEKDISTVDKDKFFYWLMVINSDILSSIEKESPIISIKDDTTGYEDKLILHRSERWHEGIEYLSILENYANFNFLEFYNLQKVMPPYIHKLKNRVTYLKSL